MIRLEFLSWRHLYLLLPLIFNKYYRISLSFERYFMKIRLLLFGLCAAFASSAQMTPSTIIFGPKVGFQTNYIKIIDDPSELASQGVAKTSSSGSDAASNLDDNEIGRLKEMLDDLGTDIFNASRQQDGSENDVKKQLADNIQSLVDDIALDSF